MYVTVIVLCITLVRANDPLKQIDSIHQEYECSSRGGICTIEADCPSGRLTEEKGLCPQQRSLGVECCYGVSQRETRCRKRGGECFSNSSPCNSVLVDKIATDCPKDTTCCALIY